MSDTPPELSTPTPEEHRFPCDQCGADMRFAPGEGKLVCDFCGNTREIEHSGDAPDPTQELDFQQALSADLALSDTVEIRTVSCPNCGARFEFEANAHAMECPFCATPVVIDTGTTRVIKPQGLLPFAITEPDARAMMTKWLGALWFAPNGLREYARKGRKLQGIYVPYWTYDADTKSRYRGERGTVYYVTRTVRRNGQTVTERVQKVRWHTVSGRVARWFDDVLVLASRALPKKYTDGLEPWDLAGLEPYQPEYLAGFRAEGYTIDLEEGYQEARAKMDAIIRREVRFDIGGDRQRIHQIQTVVSDVTFKHILLPVWMAAYKYRGKTYRFVVNGRSGRVQGERPWSIWKITFAVLAVAIIAAIVGNFLARQ